MTRQITQFWLVGILGTLLNHGAAGDLVMARDGQALATIVAPGRTEPEQFAASELARYLGQMAGCTFTVAPAAGDGPLICVGTPASVGPLLADRALRRRALALPEEGFLIRADAQRLCLIGASPRATLYAVYDFLEDDLGAAWTIPGPEGEVIPSHDPLIIRPANRVESPTFPLRSFQAMGLDGAEGADLDAALIDWCGKRKLNIFRLGWVYSWENVESRLLPEIRKRGLMSGASNHAFGQIVPAGKYEAGHPEYYALRDGERTAKGGQLCTTNPEVAEVAARELAELTARHPELTAMGMLQGDGWGFCQCQACSARLESECEVIWPGEGVPKASALILQFVNEVSRALRPQRPDVSLWFEAYSPTIEPPRDLRPDPEVGVFAWLYWRCCLHSLGDPQCARALQYAQVLRQWRAVTRGQMMVTDYWCGLTQPVPWWPTMTTMQGDYRFLRDLGVDGVEVWGLRGTWFKMADLSAYLNCELLWNLEDDAWAVIRQYCRGRYGAAADTMVRYYREIARGMNLAASENPERRVANTWPVAGMYVRDPERLRALIARAQGEADTALA
ncbi:MAG: DUF4838 domain-containing protein, partial [Candidatus Brocadiia bacterium]|nr:DUF4838 domain-containing protein [Candidatus Brocadiia bacterium]